MDTIVGQKPATVANRGDLAKDELGVTNPNLHRRIIIPAAILDGEVKQREYMLGIYGTHSYRTTEIFLHSDNSDDSEVP